MEAQTGFQAQRVAGAEPDQLDFRMREQTLDDRADPDGLDRKLISVLAGVPRPADVAFDAVQSRAFRSHEAHCRGVRRVAAKHRGGARALQRNERPMLGPQKLHVGRERAFKVLPIDRFARGIDDEHEHAVFVGLGGTRHHQVVDDAALLIEQLGVALAAEAEIDEIGTDQSFERARGGVVVRAGQKGLPHVGDVEQPRGGPRVQMLGNDPLVLHRHFIAGERHHPSTAREMQRMQRRCRERCLKRLSLCHVRFRAELPSGRNARPSPLCRGT